MKLEVVDATGPHILLSLTGALDLAGVQKIEKEFLSEATRQKSLIVDISAVSFLASFGMRLLVSAHKSLNRDGKKLILLKPQPTVEKVLLSAGMDNVTSITQDPAEAETLAA